MELKVHSDFSSDPLFMRGDSLGRGFRAHRERYCESESLCGALSGRSAAKAADQDSRKCLIKKLWSGIDIDLRFVLFREPPYILE